jgi:hypothetical protein
MYALCNIYQMLLHRIKTFNYHILESRSDVENLNAIIARVWKRVYYRERTLIYIYIYYINNVVEGLTQKTAFFTRSGAFFE